MLPIILLNITTVDFLTLQILSASSECFNCSHMHIMMSSNKMRKWKFDDYQDKNSQYILPHFRRRTQWSMSMPHIPKNYLSRMIFFPRIFFYVYIESPNQRNPECPKPRRLRSSQTPNQTLSTEPPNPKKLNQRAPPQNPKPPYRSKIKKKL